MTLSPYLLALLSAALFGAAAPASKAALGHFSSNQLAGILYLGAALGSLPLLLKGPVRMPWSMDAANRRRLLAAVLFGGVLGPVLVLLGLELSPAASVSLWLNLELVATAVLGVLFFHDSLGPAGWLAAGSATLAACVLAWGGGTAGIQAGALIALACACWGLDNQLTSLIDAISPAESTFWKGLAAGTANLGLGLALAPWTADAASVGQALLIGALCYGVSITLYIAAAQRLGATRSQVLFSTAPFMGALIAVAFLGERLSSVQALAGALFVLAIVMLTLDRHGHRHRHSAMEHEHEHGHDDSHHDHPHPDSGDGEKHSHRHLHPALEHAHPHWPDLHHRHRH
ncbi:MAG: DMT family transporter [Elusimicrobia bacterium]|nr:DMT family transporter [Elusimicrobiota bacterium]